VRAAVAAGVGWIDTAAWYGWGRAEEIVGAALAPEAPAGPVAGDALVASAGTEPVVLTKCGTVRGADGSTVDDHRAATIRADLRASLARLRRPSVDVLQLHDPDPATPVEAAWTTVCELIAEGTVRAGGLSNHSVPLMDRAAAVGPVAVVQHQYSLLHRGAEAEGVLDWCARHGSTFLAWSPLASGFLADGFDLSRLEPGDFRHRLPWADPARLDYPWLAGELVRIGRRAGLPVAALAIGWVLAKGARAIVGARSVAEAAAIAGYRPVGADLAAELEAAVAAARHRA
jgi:aryl-alcohol dehydrogenase-like predicted oxidoreductase